MPDDTSFFTVRAIPREATHVEHTAPDPPIKINSDGSFTAPDPSPDYDESVANDPAPHWAGQGRKSKARRQWEARHPGETSGGANSKPTIAIFGSGKSRGGSKSSPKVKAAPWVGNALQAAHLLVAARVGQPEWSIDQEEAVLLADAIAGVLDHYKIEMLSKEAGPWANMAGVCAMVYGPRVAAAVMKYMMNKQNNPKPKPTASEAKNTKASQANGSAPNASGITNINDPALYDPSLYAVAS